mgnify:CR=1 FL=1
MTGLGRKQTWSQALTGVGPEPSPVIPIDPEIGITKSAHSPRRHRNSVEIVTSSIAFRAITAGQSHEPRAVWLGAAVLHPDTAVRFRS